MVRALPSSSQTSWLRHSRKRDGGGGQGRVDVKACWQVRLCGGAVAVG